MFVVCKMFIELYWLFFNCKLTYSFGCTCVWMWLCSLLTIIILWVCEQRKMGFLWSKRLMEWILQFGFLYSSIVNSFCLTRLYIKLKIYSCFYITINFYFIFQLIIVLSYYIYYYTVECYILKWYNIKKLNYKI